jgi:NADH-quinone oxidoreductase subunit J
MLTLRRRGGAQHQDPSWQAGVRAADRFRMVRMDATKPRADGQEDGA